MPVAGLPDRYLLLLHGDARLLLHARQLRAGEVVDLLLLLLLLLLVDWVWLLAQQILQCGVVSLSHGARLPKGRI